MILPLVFLFCFTFGCQQQEGEDLAGEVKAMADNEAAAEVIKALYEQKVAALKAGDLDLWFDIYSVDVVYMPPNEAIVIGKDAVQQWVQPYFEQFDIGEIYSLDEIEVFGSWAFARVAHTFTFTPKAGGDAIQQTGKAIWIFKQQDNGSWKCSHTIWNNDSPPPPPPKQE